jgi:hypothetical protein
MVLAQSQTFELVFSFIIDEGRGQKAEIRGNPIGLDLAKLSNPSQNIRLGLPRQIEDRQPINYRQQIKVSKDMINDSNNRLKVPSEPDICYRSLFNLRSNKRTGQTP